VNSYLAEEVYIAQIELNLEGSPKKALALQRQGIEITKKIRSPDSLVLGCSLIRLADTLTELNLAPNESLKLLSQGYAILKGYPSMIEYAQRTYLAVRVKISMSLKDYKGCL